MDRGNFDRSNNPVKLLTEKVSLYEASLVTYSGFSIASRNSCRFHSIPVLLLMLIAACGFASADAPKTKTSPCALTEAETAGLNGDAGTDVHAVSDYSKTVYALFKTGKFDQLDCLADSARSHKETFPGGMWKIHAIYRGLTTPPLHPTEEDWAAHIELLQRWVSTRPESITARVALAESYTGYGENARGTGFADTVSESGWRLLNERNAKAMQALEQASALSTKDPEWYVAMQYASQYQDLQPSAKRALLEQAIKFEPTYYYYYRMYAHSILPNWGGEEGEIANFLQKAADQIGGDAGDILYFRVASDIVCGCQTDQQLNLSWPRIQKGFVAVEKQNGPSPENWNLMARLAQSFNDPIVAYKLFARIGDQWSEDIWHASSYFESAKKWANQMEPFIAQKQAAEDTAEANLHTPEGKSYNAAFATKIETWMQPCVEALAGKDPRTFELLIKVGKEGTINEITGGGDSPLMPCLGHQLNDFRLSKQAVFPPPPQPDYWVRFDLNPERLATAESR